MEKELTLMYHYIQASAFQQSSLVAIRNDQCWRSHID